MDKLDTDEGSSKHERRPFSISILGLDIASIDITCNDETNDNDEDICDDGIETEQVIPAIQVGTEKFWEETSHGNHNDIDGEDCNNDVNQVKIVVIVSNVCTFWSNIFKSELNIFLGLLLDGCAAASSSGSLCGECVKRRLSCYRRKITIC